MSDASEPADLTNKSVTKTIRLLREIARHPTGATATVLASATGIARPTASRLLYSLEQNGFVDRADNNYTLGWELARLGRLADPYSGLVARVQPTLDELADTLGETVTLSVPTSGGEYDVVAEATGNHVVGVAVRNLVGQRFPLHASSTGKVILASLPRDRLEETLPSTLESIASRTITDRDALMRELAEVHEQDYAVIDNELEEELLALSRPVRDSAGGLIAILTVHGPRYRFGRDRIPEALHVMQGTVERVTELLWRAPLPV